MWALARTERVGWYPRRRHAARVDGISTGRSACCSPAPAGACRWDSAIAARRARPSARATSTLPPSLYARSTRRAMPSYCSAEHTGTPRARWMLAEGRTASRHASHSDRSGRPHPAHSQDLCMRRNAERHHFRRRRAGQLLGNPDAAGFHSACAQIFREAGERGKRFFDARADLAARALPPAQHAFLLQHGKRLSNRDARQRQGVRKRSLARQYRTGFEGMAANGSLDRGLQPLVERHSLRARRKFPPDQFDNISCQGESSLRWHGDENLVLFDTGIILYGFWRSVEAGGRHTGRPWQPVCSSF